MLPECDPTTCETMIAPGWYTLRRGCLAARVWRRGREWWEVSGVLPSGEIVAGPVRVTTLRRGRIIARKWLEIQPTNGVDSTV